MSVTVPALAAAESKPAARVASVRLAARVLPNSWGSNTAVVNVGVSTLREENTGINNAWEANALDVAHVVGVAGTLVRKGGACIC